MNSRQNSLNDFRISSLQSKVEMYLENEKLLEENEMLKKQLESQTHKKSASLSQPKSNLMEIIENFQNKTLTYDIDSLKQEFDDVETLQDSIKEENLSLKQKIQKFSSLSPTIQRILELSQRLYLALQGYLTEGELNLEKFLSSAEKTKKTLENPEFFKENLNRSKEFLEKIVESLLDLTAEKTADQGCELI
jgi:hypothetical protein